MDELSGSYSYSIRGGPAPSRPPREFLEQQRHRQQQYQRSDPAPPRPFRSSLLRSQRDSVRPPSSVYSQPSPINTAFPSSHTAYEYSQPYQQTYHDQQHRNQLPQQQKHNYSLARDTPRNEDGVSPLSSPELLPTEPHRAPNPELTSPDISPIDDTDPDFTMSHTQTTVDSTSTSRPPSAMRSNIPMMRREKRQTQEAAARVVRETKSKDRLHQLAQQQQQSKSSQSKRGYNGGEVRWDPRTGELTSSNKGRPSQVKPAEYARGLVSGSDNASLDEEHIAPARSPTASRSPPAKAPASSISNFASRLRRTMQDASHSIAGKFDTEVPTESRAEPAGSVSPAAPSPKSPAGVRDLSSSTDPAASSFTSNRPAWSGASGRTALVAPVRDTKEVAPLSHVPRKGGKRAGASLKTEAGSQNTEQKNPHLIASPPASPLAGDETARQSAFHNEDAPPTPPPHDFSTTQSATPSAVQRYPSPPPTEPVKKMSQPSRTSQIKRKPQPSASIISHDDSDPFNYNNDEKPWLSHKSSRIESDYGAQSIPDPLRSSPFNSQGPFPSRAQYESVPEPHDFSADIFYAQQTPVKQKQLASPTSGGSVMDRRRPLRMGHSSQQSGEGDAEPVVISLSTPWKSGNHSSTRDRSGSGYASSGSSGNDELTSPVPEYLRSRSTYLASSADSIAESMFKDLPLAPPEMGAKDRVAMLNAHLSGLAQRRINIDRGIKQMTELMPQDNIMDSAEVILRREQEKRKVEVLREELAEIQREEYEIGLKLHRVYKRLDKDATYEPTTLWVRRVTG